MGIHDVDTVDDWSVTGTFADGSALADLIWMLNGGSTDGATMDGCFADHCDWRLPTNAELQTILHEPYPCSTSPCIDPVFGPTQANSCSSATRHTNSAIEGTWVVSFDDGAVATNDTDFYPVRAVRGGS